MKKRLITSALPYVNNIPHLGNLIQVLSADVFARFCRSRGYETLYVCGTDEYGTATETRAREEGITPEELCTRYFKIHDEIYRWFNIAFDRFGRTSTPEHTEITQGIFLKLHENGFITEHTLEQLYSPSSEMFLADRYVRGTCPHCGYEEARGDQCENCGKLLDPAELINPRSAIDNSIPEMRETKHLYINLPAILPRLQDWLAGAAEHGNWSRNAVQMTYGWIRDGLKERAITRDLKWGIPVPLDGFREKVFYVWFDAPIGYISITANYTENWKDWWQNPDEVELFQFIGKDNIPFHTVVFPSSLLGTGEPWTMLKTMSSSEYLNYETGQFSKSKGVGVFGNDAIETGIPADVWRFYIFYNRPETSDFTFTWHDFQEKVNGELIGNLSNLVNRSLTFVTRYFDGEVAAVDPADEFFDAVREIENEITELLEQAKLRDAFRKVFALASYGNRVFQNAEPWKTRTEDPAGTHAMLSRLVYLLRDLAVLAEPFIPSTTGRIAALLGIEQPRWEQLGTAEGLSRVSKPEILFERLEDERVAALQQRFSGTQSERAERDRVEEQQGPAERFLERIELRSARITEVQQHPKADKLYLEMIELGEGETRQIVSGLVGHYRPEELEGRTIILAANLKPAKLRGEKSEGMLLAAEGPSVSPSDDGGEVVEVLFLDEIEPGMRITLAEGGEPAEKPSQVTIDEFFEIPIEVRDHVVQVGGRPLQVGGKTVTTTRVANGKVG